MRERMKEHDEDIRFARTQTSAVAEHANETGHIPIWSNVKFIDRDPHSNRNSPSLDTHDQTTTKQPIYEDLRI